MSNAKTFGSNILGDEDTSRNQEDDSNPEHSTDFASAIPDEDASDYGLELTHTNNGAGLMKNIGLHKSTALLKETPVTRYTRRTTTQLMPSSNSSTDPKATTLQQQQKVAPAAAVRKPRKQKNPQQSQKRFLMDMKKLQSQRRTLMPRLPFSRLVRELLMVRSAESLKITRTALEALQEASEMYLTQQLQDAYTLTLHRGRVTLSANDMELLRFIRGRTI